MWPRQFCTIPAHRPGTIRFLCPPLKTEAVRPINHARWSTVPSSKDYSHVCDQLLLHVVTRPVCRGHLPLKVRTRPVCRGQLPLQVRIRPVCRGQLPLQVRTRPVCRGQLPLQVKTRPVCRGQLPVREGLDLCVVDNCSFR